MKRTKRTWDVSLTIVDELAKDALPGEKLFTKKEIEKSIRHLLRHYDIRGRKLKNIIASDRAKDAVLTFKDIVK